MAILAGLISMLFWGTAIFLAAVASRKVGNILTLFWMQIFGLIVGIFYLTVNPPTLDINQILRFIPILSVVALLQMIAYLAFYKGLEKGQVSLVSPLGASWGLVVAILGVIFLRESLKITQIAGISLIIAGIIALSVNIHSLLKSREVNLIAGMKEGVIALFGWGVSLFLLIAPTKELNWFLPAFIFRIILILCLFTYILLSRQSFLPKSNKFPLWLLLAIGFFDMGAFMSYSYGVSNANSSLVAVIGSAYAVVSVLFAKIFLKEKLTLSKLIGIGGVLIGLILMAI